MNDIDALRARVLAQQIQVTRLHTALSRIAASGELSGPQVATAREALDACEADAGQIAQDVRAVLSEPLPPAQAALGGGGGGDWNGRNHDARARLAATFGAA